ncbi:unnamed protein product [Discosporangium mesarthrocarpum]
MQLSLFQNKPTTAHLTAGKRLIRYLKETQDLPLRYGPGKAGGTGFADASYSSESSTSRSISGYVFFMSGAAITGLPRCNPLWHSQRWKLSTLPWRTQRRGPSTWAILQGARIAAVQDNPHSPGPSEDTGSCDSQTYSAKDQEHRSTLSLSSGSRVGQQDRP